MSDCSRYFFPASLFFLTACSGSDNNSFQKIGEGFSGIVKNINESLSPAGRNTTGSSFHRSSVHLKDTPLNNVLLNSSSEQWPRIALTFNKLPSWFPITSMGSTSKLGSYGPEDCVNVSVVLWTSSKKKQEYNNIDFCGDDIPSNISFRNISTTWKNFSFATDRNHTGKRRTTGPIPPERLFPSTPVTDYFWGHGEYFLGGIMATVGYNWNESDDRRFWVVSIPSVN